MDDAASKRATIYLSSAIHRAIKIKAVATDRTVSELVNEALKAMLAEDAEDLEAYAERAGEASVPFEDVVKDLKRRGKI